MAVNHAAVPAELTEENVAGLIGQLGRFPAVFLDYDGTLAPIQSRPDQAVLDDDMRACLIALARRCPVAIVSGRERTDVERLVGLPGLVYAGSHGLDIAGPGLRWDSPDAGHLLPELDRAFQQLQQAAKDIPGVLVERKRYAVALHYRLASAADAPKARDVIDQVARRCSGLRLTGGKKVWELRPDTDWDKGRAIEWLFDEMQRSEPGHYKPLFIGDDVTDEDGFRAVSELDGVGVVVAPQARSSAAGFRLQSVDSVRLLLDRVGPV